MIAYNIFVYVALQDTIIPIECGMTDTISDVANKLPPNQHGWCIKYKNKILPHTALLSDEEIGPDTEIQAEINAN